jgi:hypothetical protein
VASAIIHGFKNIKHAEMFINWFEGQGEQNMCDWFDCNGQEAPIVDCSTPYVKTKESISAQVKYS